MAQVAVLLLRSPTTLNRGLTVVARYRLSSLGNTAYSTCTFGSELDSRLCFDPVPQTRACGVSCSEKPHPLPLASAWHNSHPPRGAHLHSHLEIHWRPTPSRQPWHFPTNHLSVPATIASTGIDFGPISCGFDLGSCLTQRGILWYSHHAALSLARPQCRRIVSKSSGDLAEMSWDLATALSVCGARILQALE